jgi:alkanesulfonate monooxygenase SsuD/methylene tetrahydromethanopterin reductase-like flavin-dependent oxidoreductase (luciferase family)
LNGTPDFDCGTGRCAIESNPFAFNDDEAALSMKPSDVKLSYFTMPLHPPGRSYVDTLAEDREAILLADALGFSEAFVGEHITDIAETVTSSLMFCASLVHETRQIRLGSGTVNMPNNHPAQVAAQVAMIDTMLEGRFLFGISPGGLRSDAEVFGNLDADRTAMFVEAIDQVLEIWASEPPYDIKGEFWEITTARTMDVEIGQGVILKPFQKPHPPIVIAAMSPYSSSVTRAGARGWSFISANFLQPEWAATHWPKFVEGCEQAGRTPDPADWRAAKSIFVANDEKIAQAYAKSTDGPYGFYYRNIMRKLIGNGRPELFKRDPDMPDEAVTHEYVMDSLVIAGTVNSVVDQLLAFRETTGDFGTLVYAGHDWADPVLARRSMELMATQVMPAMNKALNRSAA